MQPVSPWIFQKNSVVNKYPKINDANNSNVKEVDTVIMLKNIVIVKGYKDE
ncbi:hypothetical protein JV46_10970 [Solemya velum gill symbiont]|uniref:Uncharacterized protein n=1 Tax=Solemya velum gill symbiont TaxID=2340 RepID=A0A0B0H9S0_SOVGS|nr:hypothetical protein JV46_10970 [Solemya velum gill symbiont]